MLWDWLSTVSVLLVSTVILPVCLGVKSAPATAPIVLRNDVDAAPDCVERSASNFTFARKRLVAAQFTQARLQN